MKEIHESDLWNQPDEGDPLVWLRQHRDENAIKYPTTESLSDYLRTVPSVPEMLAIIEKKIAEKRQKGYQSTDLYIEKK